VGPVASEAAGGEAMSAETERLNKALAIAEAERSACWAHIDDCRDPMVDAAHTLPDAVRLLVASSNGERRRRQAIQREVEARDKIGEAVTTHFANGWGDVGFASDAALRQALG
jgi:hypothetical protein